MHNLFLDDLTLSGHSRSAGRVAVFDFLLANGSVHPGALAQAMVGVLDRASLYRTLKLFRELGIIDELGYGLDRMIELSDRYAPHHHHLRCNLCGKVTNLDEPSLEEALRNLAATNQFVLESHVIELSGRCADCLAQK
ncbi:MAG: transcriptional repressor [Candidatus Saccharibacteria bacterium]